MSTPSSTGRRARAAAVALAVLLAGGCAGSGDDPSAPPPSAGTPSAGRSEPAAPADPAEPAPPVRLPGVVSSADVEESDDPLARWAAESRARPVQITSTTDGTAQDALWAPPPQPGAPLVVHVHSWSSGYDQEVGLPVARWADSVGWGFVQPDVRGVNDDPLATGSASTTQDVVDAVDFAVAEGGVDPERVYVTGFSGGGMMSLLVTGRYADRFAGAAAWVPVHDLVSWHRYNRDEQPQRSYAGQIEASCGGDPGEDESARADCAARSPAAVMEAVRSAEVPVYLAGGVADDVVPVVDVLRAFNALADEADRIPDDVLAAAGVGSLPPALPGGPEGDSRFTPEDPPVLFSRSSAAATVVVFDGGHEFVYYPGLDWLARLDAARPAPAGG